MYLEPVRKIQFLKFFHDLNSAFDQLHEAGTPDGDPVYVKLLKTFQKDLSSIGIGADDISAYAHEYGLLSMYRRLGHRAKIHSSKQRTDSNQEQMAMSEYGGWEKLHRIGGGGQSEVYLARCPERVKQRQELLASTHSANGLGAEGQFAEAVITYGRHDRLDELGALKIFKIRESGAPPLDRLKREIDVLAKGRPNLPRLLDSNADELWMITEYFPDGTLADKSAKYKGKSLEALVSFRGLVEAVAALHEDEIVHRDIKPANIFISPEGRLVPGDFGLVFHPANQSRLTRSNERVGPSEHLPWWANVGVRLESPTPAIDVFLLGTLLWCMVSGDHWLHGERYKHDVYNLEKRFPLDGSMRWINLVLSQCLGDEENKCLKNARGVLEVVDDVISTITKGTPIFDENNELVMPCCFCKTGFYRRMTAQQSAVHTRLNMSDELGRVVDSPSFDIFMCDACSNTQFFSRNQPSEVLQRGRKGRINARSSPTT